ncbi:MAG: glycoside hydrolase family 13 protein, partial [Staphylothermus sp.]|nr:glycoside hydrolase family 13 protein [Staphylothermus sp.]
YEFHVEANDLSRTLVYKFLLKYKEQLLEYGDEGIGEKASYIVVDKKNIKSVDKPKWWMGTIYYQIFVDSFENGDPTNDPEKKISRTVPREHGYYGGDLRGIINRFKHIKDLGIETIYLTPIFHALSYHRYDVCDYYKIDPYLGDLNDFKELVDLLHKNGIKIVLDIPPIIQVHVLNTS